MKLLTPHEVADLYRVSEEKILEWVAEGYIKAGITPDGEMRFTEEEIQHSLVEGGLLDPERPPTPKPDIKKQRIKQGMDHFYGQSSFGPRARSRSD